MSRHYVTTAIDFPNAAPHMGHVYEKILADVIVRWLRLRGDDVRFHLGTDENGIKIQQTAKNMKVTPRELVDRNAPIFEDVFRQFHISFDYFIRTADPKTHWPTVVAFWNKLKEAGYLEKRSYAGLYCTGCERFVTAKDLVDGKCPDHGTAPQEVTEENWFFLLSRKQKDMQTLLKTGGYAIIPGWRANETLTFLDGGLEDVSFSRSTQTLSWGVPVPDDANQVMYVWCDNLTSYISSLGFFTDHEMRQWWDDATVTHIIGKDIARFHAVNWPAMLQCAGVRTPDRLLVHGFITNEGQKMSKSLGNVVDPKDVLEKFNGNPDPLRFFLMHEIPVGNDGDFSWERLGASYSSILANRLGNSLNRLLVLLRKDGGTLLALPQSDLSGRFADAWQTYGKGMETFQCSESLQFVSITLLDFLSQFIQEKKPWSITDVTARGIILSEIAEMLRQITLMLLPFIPGTAQRIARQLNLPDADRMLAKDFVITDSMKQWGGATEWKRVGEPEILFPPLEK